MRPGGQQRQVSFAELEWQAQGIRLESSLQGLSDLLDRHDELLELVASDLRRGLKQPAAGREGLSAVQVLRSFILQRVKDWDFRELRERVADGLTLRQFTGFYAGRVPRHQAFHRAFKRLTPETLRALNHAVVVAAVELGIEHGHHLRVDTTVVQTNIRFPTDATLLWDCVRVLTRLGGRIVEQLPGLSERLHNRTRFARRRMQELQRMTPAQRRLAQRPTYRRLITVTTQVVANAGAVAKAAAAAPPEDEFARCRIAQLIAEIETYSGHATRVISQARRRVLEGEQVVAAEKLYSIFEPHTDLIKRGKLNTPVEFGHKVFLAESRTGLITDYQVLDGNPPDDPLLVPALERHCQLFGHLPRRSAADRGFYSVANVAWADAAAAELVSIPQRGGHKTPERTAFEKSRAFKRAQKFRAGIEGRISVLARGRGMKRCRLHGRQRFELLVGAAVLANNLLVIAAGLQAKPTRRRAA
jgi:transposase, IS5 family